VRRCGRSMNRQVRDRGTGMRLTVVTDACQRFVEAVLCVFVVTNVMWRSLQ